MSWRIERWGPRALVEFLAPFRVVALSRAIAWRTAALQSSHPRRLGENDAWIAASALSYDATLIGRERAFERVLRLNFLSFYQSNNDLALRTHPSTVGQ
jgi:predicted nucleic acid-binding protein